ncbi:MAG TPA: M1 family metallopeptidase, partial [Kofleriaceae bacterium]|nr:M1 family metallopeptidase [Kofleriaceae bacterium]
MRLAVALLVCVACSGPERAKAPRPAAGAPLTSPGLRLPDDALPLAYDLRLEIDPEQENFAGTVAIRTRLTTATDHVWLHADRITIKDAHWDGGALALDPVQGDQMRAFRFGRRVDPGVVTLSFSFTGSLATDQEGLFRQRATGGGWYVFSQGESVFARRFTPCFDEPRFKTPWKVTLVVPKADVALSNMREASVRGLPDGRKELVFAESPPLPSYLVAIAVGPFDLVEAGKAGKGNVPVRVAVRRGAAKQVGVVAARLPAVLAALEAYTGEALPAQKLDLVAVPHLFGAMENPGLITFDEPMLVGDPKDHELANYFVLVAAHELSHQWFGNAVTPAWWDDLWLSEGFASWLGNKVERDLGAIDDPQLRAALTRRDAIAADEGENAAPLRRVMLHNEDPDNSFDEIAYQKGHAVLSTFEAYLGADKFRDVLRAYLASHRGGTATTADLVAEIRKATDDATAQSFELYVRKTGVPVVDLALRCDAHPAVIAHAHDHAVPVCIRYATAKASAESC